MSGETGKVESGWTTDTLKEHMNQRFTDNDKAVQAALLSAKEAVLKAEVASEKRFESVNEFRGQLADQSATLMPRAEANTKFDSMNEKLTDITNRLNISQGASKGLQAGWGYLVGAVGLAAVIIGTILAFNN